MLRVPSGCVYSGMGSIAMKSCTAQRCQSRLWAEAMTHTESPERLTAARSGKLMPKGAFLLHSAWKGPLGS